MVKIGLLRLVSIPLMSKGFVLTGVRRHSLGDIPCFGTG